MILFSPPFHGGFVGKTMVKTLGYHITWTTYGTWLQGDSRGYVKNGETLPANKALYESNQNQQIQDTVKLPWHQQEIVRLAIIKQAEMLNQQIYALTVKSTHVHLVVECTPEPIAKIVAYYKNAARQALKTAGREGKVWTAGYDKRFCFDTEALERVVRYVQNHNK
jgi:REP element-mobilizing transposase RayT